MKTLREAGIALLAAGMLCGCEDQDKQLAAAMTGGNPDAGRHEMEYYGCASCHVVPGVAGADGMVGPPLSQIADRTYLGGVIENTPANMVRWIMNAPGVDPRTAMPNLDIARQPARDIASYLYTLK